VMIRLKEENQSKGSKRKTRKSLCFFLFFVRSLILIFTLSSLKSVISRVQLV
jgi:hypothetical protein